MLRSVLGLLLLLIAVVTIAICWSGYRVTSAMNHGALRARVATCLDVRHLELREAGRVSQKIVDHVLSRQIAAHYFQYPKRRLPYSLMLLSSQTGWQTFWSPDERRQMYLSLERRMPPCPSALQRFLEIQRTRAH
jgi:hypothetical protein